MRGDRYGRELLTGGGNLSRVGGSRGVQHRIHAQIIKRARHHAHKIKKYSLFHTSMLRIAKSIF